MKLTCLALLMATLVSGPTLACDMNGLTGIVENNNLWIGTEQVSFYGIDKTVFDKIIDDISAIYAPIIKSKGGNLLVARNWTDGTVNAYAEQIGTTWKVSMFGGLARHQTITPDGFALVLCHELGHHLGGAPKINEYDSEWASNEGQADLFGNLKCMREYMENQDNLKIVAGMTIDPFAVKTCEAQFADANDQAICKRSAMAGMSLGNLFKVLSGSRVAISFTTPDKTVVSQTNDAHPATQCRLDTYFAGAVCEVAKETEVSDTDPNVGVCATALGHKLGVRPLCWFKPE